MRYRLRTLLIVSATVIVVLGLAIGTDAGREAWDWIKDTAWAWLEANVLFLVPNS
jgi:hypothetical protein